MRLAIIAAALVTVGCAPENHRAEETKSESAIGDGRSKTFDIFDGELIALNDRSVRGSNLRIAIFAAGENADAPKHYMLLGGCDDHGFLDPADGKFWSGSTPEKNGEMADFLRAKDRSSDYLVEDVARYHELIELMEEGATLSFGPNRTTAKFTTSSKRVAEFRYYASPMVD